ncbi:ATP-binding protein [Alsobacter sp. KACC 23698]|uniref:Mg-protoporphyrin IX chelatase n=1 Tax=Alsobacter sp. KACC 23698 TaxID=3149229 RepID=A0AAU7JNV0_9HYPH
MKLALLAAAVDPTIGGVLALGDRGTGKSTAIRSLAALLPERRVVRGCPYGCGPSDAAASCPHCAGQPAALRKADRAPVPVVELPLGATEDRIVGALDLERALSFGEKVFQPGLLARANRGFLYVDEVNLLDDHLVDLLIDVAASGENLVEREGLSVRHPARFVLVGSGNPEEGDLRPQLLDRFGLAVEVRTPTGLAERVEVVRRRDAFDRDPHGFAQAWSRRDAAVRRRVVRARAALGEVETPLAALEQAARLCLRVGTDGLRGELTLIRAARALASLDGEARIMDAHLRRVAPLALAHRLRRNPLDDARSAVRVEQAVLEVLGPP